MCLKCSLQLPIWSQSSLLVYQTHHPFKCPLLLPLSLPPPQTTPPNPEGNRRGLRPQRRACLALRCAPDVCAFSSMDP